MEKGFCFLLLSLVGTSMGADFFTGMDRRIGCFFDKSNDRYIKQFNLNLSQLS